MWNMSVNASTRRDVVGEAAEIRRPQRHFGQQPVPGQPFEPVVRADDFTISGSFRIGNSRQEGRQRGAEFGDVARGVGRLGRDLDKLRACERSRPASARRQADGRGRGWSRSPAWEPQSSALPPRRRRARRRLWPTAARPMPAGPRQPEIFASRQGCPAPRARACGPCPMPRNRRSARRASGLRRCAATSA